MVGKFHPAAAGELLASLPTALPAVLRGKISPKTALFGHKIPKQDLKQVQKIYKEVDKPDHAVELNLYVTGYEDEDQVPAHAPHDDEPDDHTSTEEQS